MDHRAPVTIQSLPNEVLLHIFSFHRLLSGTKNRPPSVARRWLTLAHVCQRWRHLIFGSLRHLEARLVISSRSPMTWPDSWPALPISVWYDSGRFPFAEEVYGIVAVLRQHSDRIREISLPSEMAYLLDIPFPELEHLSILGSFYFDGAPGTFLGSSAPVLSRLCSLVLSGFYFPALPQLLLSSRDLVFLHLGDYALGRDEFVSPKVLATSLSVTTQLEHLYIDTFPLDDFSYPELMNENPFPLNPVVFPALSYFHFAGLIEYMENLIPWIDAPHLEKLDISSDQSVLDIPQISKFISRTKWLSSLPFRTFILLHGDVFSIEHHFKRLLSPKDASHVHFRGAFMENCQLSQVYHICTQLSPLASIVKQLKLSIFKSVPDLQQIGDPTPWLQLLMPYNSVEEIEISGLGAMCTGIALALKQSTEETAQDLLPALRILRIRGFDDGSISLTMSFVAARERIGRPVIIRHLPMRKDWEDMYWETVEDNTRQD